MKHFRLLAGATMATPVGTMLGVGMLGLAAVILLAALAVTALVDLPEEQLTLSAPLRQGTVAGFGAERQVTTAL